jgi:hypothetical protein
MINCMLIAAKLALASAGATVATGPIQCDSQLVLKDRDYRGVTLDATGAQFPEGAMLRNVQGLTIKGGTWGRTDVDTAALHVIRAYTVTDFSINNATILGNGNLLGGGIKIQSDSVRVTVRDNRLDGHMLAIGVSNSTDVLITRNVMSGSTSDGINSVGNQNAIISANLCRDFNRIKPAHADCIQLWSIKDKPLQADVYVINNAAIGDMQGILSSDPKTGSGRRLFFHGNYMAVTRSHTITCGACVESVATDNVLASFPPSMFGIGSLKGFAHPSNITARNVRLDGEKSLPPRIWSNLVPPIANRVGSRFDDRSFAGPRVQPTMENSVSAANRARLANLAATDSLPR